MARDSKGQPPEAKRKNDEWSEKSKNDTGGVVRIRESSKKRFEAQKGMKRFGAYEAWNQDRESLQRVVGLRTSGRVHREETRTLRSEDDRRASRQVGNEASVIVGQAKKKQQLRVEALIIIILFVSKSVFEWQRWEIYRTFQRIEDFVLWKGETVLPGKKKTGEEIISCGETIRVWHGIRISKKKLWQVSNENWILFVCKK